jgi:hypothetical protein
MSVSHEAAARGKTSRHLRFKAPNPGASRVHPVESSSAARSVYDGRERLGSYRQIADRWVAVDRLGRPLGQFDTELEAQAAISAAAGVA